MILLIDENLAYLFGHGEFAETFALPHTLSIISDRLVLVFKIKAKHLAGVFGGAYLFWSGAGHFAEVVDLARYHQRMFQLLRCMRLQLIGDVHIFCAFEDLGINDIGDNRLIFSREVLIEKFRKT